MKRGIAVTLGLALSLAFGGAQEKVSVAAAANLSAVGPSLGARFAERNPGYRAEFTFGASGALVAQLLNGAPYQILLSADVAYAQKLVEAGEAQGPVRVYAVGTLILLTTRDLDLRRGLDVLTDPGVRQVANSNPEVAPYGRAAQEALVKAGLFERVRSKIVVAQNVTQALQFTLTGADAGFVAKSSLYSPGLRKYRAEGRFWVAVDPTLYDPIAQGFVVMKTAVSRPAGSAFVTFLSSPAARAVFASFGYATP
jgi:molybdate transport system substrate-binding protein